MILVTGATGRTGEQVVHALRRLGLDVRALVRKGSEYYWLNETGCRYFFGDLRDPLSLARAVSGMRYVISCAGVRVETRDNHHLNVTEQGHQALFEAARTAGVERVVLLSCAGAARAEAIPAFRSKRTAEQQLQRSGLDFTILRAHASEHLFLDLAWWVKRHGRVPLPAPGDNLLSPLPALDLARMAASSLDLAATRNKVLTVGGAASMSARAAFELACEAVGVPANAVVLPRPVAAAATRVGRPLRRYGRLLAELAVWFGEDLPLDGEAAARPFGLPLTPLPDAMRASAEVRATRADPEARAAAVVHRQFYATIYQPGTTSVDTLPDGPAPRRS